MARLLHCLCALCSSISLCQLLSENIPNWELAYNLIGLTHYYHDGEHGSMQAVSETVADNYILIHGKGGRERERELKGYSQ